MLLGNKTDLESQREIQFRVGEKLAKAREFTLGFSLQNVMLASGKLQDSVPAASYL